MTPSTRLNGEDTVPKAGTTTSLADLADKAGRHYRSRYVARDDAASSPARWLWLLAVVLVAAAAVLLVRLIP